MAKNVIRQTFNVSFVCRKSKADRMGKSPIELVININGERVYYQLAYKIESVSYAKAMSGKRMNEVKRYTNKVYNDVMSMAADMQLNGVAVTAQGLKDCYRSGMIKAAYTINDLFNEYLGILAKRTGVDLELCVYRKYELCVELFRGIVDCSKALVECCNGDILLYEAELKKKYKKSTIAGYMSKMKSFFVYAIRNGKISLNPFGGIKISKKCEEVVIITDEEYERIKGKGISIERLAKVRDAFIFGCGSGLSYADMCQLCADDFKVVDGKYVINKCRMKTGVEFFSVLTDDAVAIAKKYEFNLRGLMLSNQKINSYLKEIADICSVVSVVSLHWHISRHYYISGLVKRGINMEIVKRCAGHTNTQMTSRYTHIGCSDIVKQVG